MNELATLDAYGVLTEPATLKIQRLLPGPIERVWAYLTESELRRQWLAAGQMEMKVGAPVEFVWRNDELNNPPSQRPAGFTEEHRMQSRITELDPPRKLAIAWGGSGDVSFELDPKGDKVLLTVIHRRLPDRATLLKVSAGWHMHLDILVARATGKEPAPFWDGWSGLEKEYDLRLTGRPGCSTGSGRPQATSISTNRRLTMQNQVVSRNEWLRARVALLKEEKELTRRSDELARRRQVLPWVRVDKEYRFETDEGSASLADLLRGRSQLLVYHFMFGPDYKAGCPSCSGIADGFDGIVVHLANHDVTLSAVSRAPIAKLQAYKRRMGWTFPWVSSLGGDFNFDFNVSFTDEQQREGVVEYNYQRRGHAMYATSVPEPVARFAAMCGTDAPTYSRDRPGLSAFVLEDGVVYHTYSTYARGLDGLWGMYQWLDRAPKGRNETSA